MYVLWRVQVQAPHCQIQASGSAAACTVMTMLAAAMRRFRQMLFAAETDSCAILHATGQHPWHYAVCQTQTGVAFATIVSETMSRSTVGSLTRYRSRYDNRRLVKLLRHACRTRLAS